MNIPTPFIVLAVAVLAFQVHSQIKNTVSPAEETAYTQLHWLTDFEAAQARARAENKVTLINFTGSDWCPPCKRLRKEVFSQPEFASYANEHLSLLDVDFPRHKQLSREQQAANEALARKFGIESFPTVVVVNAENKVLGHLGYTPGGPKAFTAEIEQIRKAAGR
ncbi:MAG: thioredoxin family protein [Verrucomicrobiaceae bacterium]|nr:MAG: thioredoxin family protein [Verrucomicrobiaceae bacterium]